MPGFGAPDLRGLNPLPDPMEALRRVGTGAADVSGVTGLVQQLQNGGGLNTFARHLAGGDPGAAWDQYAQWRGPILNSGGQMALPIGPWGSAGIAAGLARTGPARSIGQGMANQAKLEMFRDASRSIEAAPQLSPGQAWAQGSMNELQMRNMGMSRAQLQAKNEQARLRAQTAELAHSDQAYATVNHLSSLLPEQSVVPHLSDPTQGILRNILGGARTDANNMLNRQPIGGERPGIGPLTEGTSIPQMLERVRNQVVGVMRHDARIQPTADQAQPIRQAAANVQRNIPGNNIEPLWNLPAYRGRR